MRMEEMSEWDVGFIICPAGLSCSFKALSIAVMGHDF